MDHLKQIISNTVLLVHIDLNLSDPSFFCDFYLYNKPGNIDQVIHQNGVTQTIFCAISKV